MHRHQRLFLLLPLPRLSRSTMEMAPLVPISSPWRVWGRRRWVIGKLLRLNGFRLLHFLGLLKRAGDLTVLDVPWPVTFGDFDRGHPRRAKAEIPQQERIVLADNGLHLRGSDDLLESCPLCLNNPGNCHARLSLMNQEEGP